MNRNLNKLRTWLSAPLPTERWTICHRWRYGSDPAKIADSYARYIRKGSKPRPTPWLFRFRDSTERDARK